MRLLVLFGDDPRLDSVQDHVIHGDPVPEMDWLLYPQHTQDLQLYGSQVVEQVVQLHIFAGRLDALVDGYDQLVGLVDGQRPLGVDDGLDAGLDEFLLEDIQVLEIVLFVDEVVLQGGDGALHVEDACLLALEPHGTDRHEVAHDSLGGDHSQLIVPFNLVLQLHGHDLLASLDQFEILLLGEFETCDFVVEDADVPQEVLMRVIFDDIRLMAERDAPEELGYGHFGHVAGPGKNDVSLFILEIS